MGINRRISRCPCQVFSISIWNMLSMQSSAPCGFGHVASVRGGAGGGGKGGDYSHSHLPGDPGRSFEDSKHRLERVTHCYDIPNRCAEAEQEDVDFHRYCHHPATHDSHRRLHAGTAAHVSGLGIGDIMPATCQSSAQ